MQNKVCNKCNQNKPIEAFYTHKSTADGYRPACKPCSNAYQKTPEYLAKERERRKARYPETKEGISIAQKKYRDSHKEQEADRVKRHREENKDSYRKRMREYVKDRRQNDPIFNLVSRLRCRIREVLIRGKYTKTSKTQTIIGCSWEDLRTYLIATWNAGYPGKELVWTEVHVDHIVPLCTANTEEELLKLNHYSNLQLLLAKDNLSKGGRHSS
jgi:hypothetical protein